MSLFKNWDGPYLYSAGHSVLTKLVPNQTVMSVRPISGWLKVGLPIKMRTIKPPMGKWYKYCFNFKTDFWLMTKLILFLLIKTITIILFLLVIAFYCYDTSVTVAKVLVMKLFQNFLFVLSVRIYTSRKI